MWEKKKDFQVLLIDGDVLVYRAGFSPLLDKENQWKHALYCLKAMLTTIKDEFGVVNNRIFLTSDDKSNFRFKIAKTKVYKENRKDMKKPPCYDELREYLIKYSNAEVISGREADDALGCAQTSTSVICTIDKDLDMVPGWHYNFVTKELFHTSDNDNLVIERQKKISKNDKKYYHYKLKGGGIKWFYAQMLLGDRCDNIPGIKGLGPVAVEKILAPCISEDDMIKCVYREYEKSIINKEERDTRFLEIADLLWIQRKKNEKKSEELKCWILKD